MFIPEFSPSRTPPFPSAVFYRAFHDTRTPFYPRTTSPRFLPAWRGSGRRPGRLVGGEDQVLSSARSTSDQQDFGKRRRIRWVFGALGGKGGMIGTINTHCMSRMCDFIHRYTPSRLVILFSSCHLDSPHAPVVSVVHLTPLGAGKMRIRIPPNVSSLMFISWIYLIPVVVSVRM